MLKCLRFWRYSSDYILWSSYSLWGSFWGYGFWSSYIGRNLKLCPKRREYLRTNRFFQKCLGLSRAVLSLDHCLLEKLRIFLFLNACFYLVWILIFIIIERYPYADLTTLNKNKMHVYWMQWTTKYTRALKLTAQN